MTISAPQWEALLLAVLMIAMTLLLGLWIVRRVSVWAQNFSANTTERLEQLVRYCEDILNGHPLTLPSKELDDAISSVLRALRKMLSQQKLITDEIARQFAALHDGCRSDSCD